MGRSQRKKLLDAFLQYRIYNAGVECRLQFKNRQFGIELLRGG